MTVLTTWGLCLSQTKAAVFGCRGAEPGTKQLRGRSSRRVGIGCTKKGPQLQSGNSLVSYQLQVTDLVFHLVLALVQVLVLKTPLVLDVDVDVELP